MHLLGVFVIIAGLYLGMIPGPSFTPALGLDLRGGTQVTLTAQPLSGKEISSGALKQAVNIIRQRVDAIGVGGAEIKTQGGKHIIVSVPGKSNDQVASTVGQTALMRFRQALAIGPYTPAQITTTTTTPPATGGKDGKKKKSQGDVVRPALLAKPKPSAKPTASPTPTASVSATPTATSSSEDESADAENQPLPNSQSPELTPEFQDAFAHWDCEKNPNPTNGNDNPDYYIIACDPDDRAVYLLAPAAVEGQQLTGASAGLNTNGVGWVVNLTFNGSGGRAWLDVTKKAYEVTGGTPSQSCSPPQGCNAVAIVLDGIVKSAPYISQPGGIAGGQAQISGNFDQKSASDLANVLKYGSLPLKFTQSDVQTVSASLGAQQLRGGLIAGAIGLGLVILFSMFYYRGLGLVAVGSLAVSGAILYSVTTLLGHSSLGYTLSLPGIAGFIVAVGITVDSFVVYFERLRDEIREGKRMRSAVDRAWPKARRTIMSADTVSLLAALILYLVSIGDVRGFAFTLGLSTISDIFIVFFFTKPLLQVLGRMRAFDSGKAWTGIGRARAGVTRETAAEARTQRTREQEA
jgi:preprotein translocase subunit SecD